MKREYFNIFIKPYSKPIVLLFIFGLFQFLLPLFYPLLTKTAIDDVFIGSSDAWSLEKIIACFACLYIASIAIEYVNNMVSDKLSHTITTTLKLKLFGHAQNLPKSYYDNENTGTIAARVNHDTSDVGRLLLFISSLQ